MVDDNIVIQYIVNGGGLALALWLISRKIDDLRTDMKELNTSLKDIIMKVISK